MYQKAFFVTSSASSLIMIFMLLLIECITCSSSLSSSEEKKLIVFVNSTFHVPDFLRLFMIPFRYGLMLLRYSSTDSILFLSPLLLYSM